MNHQKLEIIVEKKLRSIGIEGNLEEILTENIPKDLKHSTPLRDRIMANFFYHQLKAPDIDIRIALQGYHLKTMTHCEDTSDVAAKSTAIERSVKYLQIKQTPKQKVMPAPYGEIYTDPSTARKYMSLFKRHELLALIPLACDKQDIAGLIAMDQLFDYHLKNDYLLGDILSTDQSIEYTALNMAENINFESLRCGSIADYMYLYFRQEYIENNYDLLRSLDFELPEHYKQKISEYPQDNHSSSNISHIPSNITPEEIETHLNQYFFEHMQQTPEYPQDNHTPSNITPEEIEIHLNQYFFEQY